MVVAAFLLVRLVDHLSPEEHMEDLDQEVEIHLGTDILFDTAK